MLDSSDRLKTLCIRTGALLLAYTGVATAVYFVKNSLESLLPVLAVVLAFLCIAGVPRILYQFLDSYRVEGRFSLWRRYSARALVVSLLLIPTLWLTDYYAGFLVYGITGGICAFLAGVHGFCAWLSRGNPDHSPAPHPSRVAPEASPATPASSIKEAKKVKEFEHKGFYEQHILFSPDGTRLATWMPDEIQVFETGTGERLGALTGPRFPVCFSPDGQRLVSTGNGVVETWTLPTFKLHETISEPSSGQSSPDGWKAFVWKNKNVDILHPATGFVTPLTGHDWSNFNPYRTAYSSKKGHYFCSLGQSAGTVNLQSEKVEWQSPSAGRDVTAVAVSADGKCAVYGSIGGSVFVVDLEQAAVVGRLMVPGEIRCIAFAPDGRHVAVGCGDLLSDVVVLDVSSGPQVIAKPGYSNTWAVAFSPDGKLLAVGSDNGKLSLWDWT